MKNVKLLPKDSPKGFNFLPVINRAVSPKHVSKIADSLKLYNEQLRPVVVADIDFLPGEKGTFIIDGQHLYSALLRMGWDIYYIKIKVKDLEDLIEKIAKINSSSKSWVMQDYINTWAYYKKEYQVLKELIDKYDIERTLVAQLLHTNNMVASTIHFGGSEAISRTIKAGKLQIDDLAETEKILQYVCDLKSSISDIGAQQQRIVISVLIEKMKSKQNYNHGAFKKKLVASRKELLLASGDLDAMRAALS